MSSSQYRVILTDLVKNRRYVNNDTDKFTCTLKRFTDRYYVSTIEFGPGKGFKPITYECPIELKAGEIVYLTEDYMICVVKYFESDS